MVYPFVHRRPRATRGGEKWGWLDRVALVARGFLLPSYVTGNNAFAFAVTYANVGKSTFFKRPRHAPLANCTLGVSHFRMARERKGARARKSTEQSHIYRSPGTNEPHTTLVISAVIGRDFRSSSLSFSRILVSRTVAIQHSGSRYSLRKNSYSRYIGCFHNVLCLSFFFIALYFIHYIYLNFFIVFSFFIGTLFYYLLRLLFLVIGALRLRVLLYSRNKQLNIFGSRSTRNGICVIDKLEAT